MSERVRELLSRIGSATDLLARIQTCIDVRNEVKEKIAIPEEFLAVYGLNNVGFFMEDWVGFYSPNGRIIVADGVDICTIELDEVNQNEFKKFVNEYPYFESRFYSWVRDVLEAGQI